MPELEKILMGVIGTMVGGVLALVKIIKTMYDKQLKERDTRIIQLEDDIQGLRTERDEFLETVLKLRRNNGNSDTHY